MRVTPSLPQWGRQHAGSIPLTPSFSEYFFNLISGYRNRGMPERRGRKHCVLEPPRAIDCFYEGFNKAVYNRKDIDRYTVRQNLR